MKNLTDPAAQHVFIIVRIGMVEVLGAINRKLREGNIAAAAYPPVVADVRVAFLSQYQLVEITVAMANLACLLVERHPLKGYDAVHLAAALLANAALQASGIVSLTFLSADTKLLTAAITEGLLTDNPDNYP